MASKIVNTALTVAVKGTSIPISATPLLTTEVLIQGNVDNTNNIFVGDSTVDGISSPPKGVKLAASESIVFEEPTRGEDFIDLSTIFIDADTSGSVAEIVFYREI